MSRDEWYSRYRDAVLETNFDKLLQRIDEAERAIAERASLDGQVPPGERRELQESKSLLQVLRKERIELHNELGRE